MAEILIIGLDGSGKAVCGTTVHSNGNRIEIREEGVHKDPPILMNTNHSMDQLSVKITADGFEVEYTSGFGENAYKSGIIYMGKGIVTKKFLE